jgi:hypothetical protein
LLQPEPSTKYEISFVLIFVVTIRKEVQAISAFFQIETTTKIETKKFHVLFLVNGNERNI